MGSPSVPVDHFPWNSVQVSVVSTARKKVPSIAALDIAVFGLKVCRRVLLMDVVSCVGLVGRFFASGWEAAANCMVSIIKRSCGVVLRLEWCCHSMSGKIGSYSGQLHHLIAIN